MTNSGAVCSLSVQHSPDSSETPPLLLLSHRILVYLLCSGQCDPKTARSQGRMLSWCPETPKQKKKSHHGQDRLSMCWHTLAPAKETPAPSTAERRFGQPMRVFKISFLFCHTESEEKNLFLSYLNGSTQFASLNFFFLTFQPNP